MSRGLNVPRHWILVTRHKQVGPGESQRLLRDLVWPLIFSCFVSSWCGSPINTKLFLQWVFTAGVSMHLVFFLLFAIFSPPWTVNSHALISFFVVILHSGYWCSLFSSFFASGLQKHLLPFYIFPLQGNSGSLENVLKAKENMILLAQMCSVMSTDSRDWEQDQSDALLLVW